MPKRDEPKLDDLDLKIIHALQTQPRAPWNLVGACVGVNPVTAARRWQRLTEQGVAWISCFPTLEPSDVAAIVEVQCRPQAIVAIARELARDAHARTLQIQSDTFDIGIVAVARSQRDMSRYVLDRIPAIEGVMATRTLPISGSYRDITRWRLRALDPSAERRLVPPPAPRSTGGPLDWELIRVLSREPRISVGELAAALGVSAATARRRLAAAENGQVQLMCELATPLSPWPTQFTLWASCPMPKIEAVAREVSRIPDVVAVFTTIGSDSLDIAVRLRSVQEMARFEDALAQRVPELRIRTRMLVLRLIKWGGQVLDDDGFASEYVPVDIRQDPLSPSSSRV